MAAEGGARTLIRKKREKRAVVEIPAVFNDKTPFVPPPAALKRCAGLSQLSPQLGRLRALRIERAC